MTTESIKIAHGLSDKADKWLDRASPWVPFWSAFCLRRARVYGDQIIAMAHESARLAGIGVETDDHQR